jgi:hypothetical protein
MGYQRQFAKLQEEEVRSMWHTKELFIDMMRPQICLLQDEALSKTKIVSTLEASKQKSEKQENPQWHFATEDSLKKIDDSLRKKGKLLRKREKSHE